MLNPQAFSVKGFKKKIFLNIASIFSLYKKVSFHATNEDEANYIKSIIGSSTSVGIAANLPRKAVETLQTKTFKQSPVRFVNVARVSIEKGTLIMLNALKRISKPLELDLYGPIYDQDYWQKCQAVISELPQNMVVTYKGVLPSEVIPKTLAAYDAFILLSEGENFGHAILEALSIGLPVIISNRTPWKDLEYKTIGWDINTKNTSHILKAINTIMEMSDLEYAKWSKAAFEYAVDIINNPKVLEQNKALFLNATKKQ
jgi:glycosyltransferase involved in cell wall biosynthesis